jgi:hypothetical protein
VGVVNFSGVEEVLSFGTEVEGGIEGIEIWTAKLIFS